MPNFDEMTVAQLEEHNQKLMADKQAIHDEQIALNAALTRKIAAVHAETITKSLSDEQKRALAQHLSVEGIASKETIGTPSA